MLQDDDACSRCGLAPRSPHHIPFPNPDTTELSKTNNPPSIRQRGLLQNDLLSVRSSIHEIADEISRVEKVLDGLHQEHQRLVNIENVYQTVLHPIRRVPDEVCAQIFRGCVNNSGIWALYAPFRPDTFITNSLDTSKPPWTLSQVCRRWRGVALADVCLWSHLGVVFPDPRTTSKEKRAKMVSHLMLQIQRSRLHPLSVSLASEYDFEDCHPLLIAVCSHSARWETLLMCFAKDRSRSLQHIGSMIEGNIPTLRYLHLTPGESIATLPIDSEIVVDGFQYAPSLQDLTIRGHTSRLANILRIPWDQITRYRAYDHPIKNVEQSINYTALSRMSNLKILHEQRKFRENLVHISPMSLPSLHTLSLITFGDEPQGYRTLSKLFELLTLSNLRDFRTDATMEVEHLPQFLSRSAATLRVLKLRVKDPTAVEPLLERVPGVEDLALRGTSLEALHALAERNVSTGNPRLLPKLQKLGLWKWLNRDDTFDDSLTLTLVQSRVEPAQPADNGTNNVQFLRTLEIDAAFDVQLRTLQCLQSLKARGLEVKRSKCSLFFLSPEKEWS